MKKQIAKCIKEISSGAYSPQVVFFDWMQCLALAISNTCTLIHNDLWKKRFANTIKKPVTKCLTWLECLLLHTKIQG